MLSLAEGYGLTPDEALAQGAALLVTDVGGLRRFEHGSTAVVVDGVSSLYRKVRPEILPLRSGRRC